jgi:hypothetical protein
MKSAAPLLGALLGLAASLSAQQAGLTNQMAAPALEAEPTPQQEKLLRQILEAPKRPPPAKSTTYGGVLGRAAKADKPWQLLNPLAPPEYGDGTEHLTFDPLTGRAQGISLFSIRFEFRAKPKVKTPVPPAADAKQSKARAKGKLEPEGPPATTSDKAAPAETTGPRRPQP